MFNRVTHNWTLKLTSFVLAIALWSHVRGEVNPWEDAKFQVRLAAAPPRSLILSNDTRLPAYVKVTVRAPRQRLRELKGNTPANPLAPADEAPILMGAEIRAWVNFSLARKGVQELPILTETASDELQVIGVKPGTIKVSLDQPQSVSRVIAAHFAPELADGLTIQKSDITPSRAKVSGPSELLAKVARIRARIDISNPAVGDLRVPNARVEAVDSAGRVVEGVLTSPPVAVVELRLKERQTERTLRVAASATGAVAAGFELGDVTVSPSRVTVRGPQRTVSEMGPLTVSVNVEGAAGNLRRRVKLDVPDDVAVEEGGTVTVRVAVAKQAAPAPAGDGATGGRTPDSDSALAPRHGDAARNGEADAGLPKPAPQP